MDLKRKGVVVFAKVPGLGIAKTRIGNVHGREMAEEIYRELLYKTFEAVNIFDYHIAFCGGDDPGELRSLFCNASSFFKQEGETLGERLESAFKHLFNAGYNFICAVGCDTPDMKSDDIKETFCCFNKGYDVVIGPAEDGGYYLAGCNEDSIGIFSAELWSTEHLLKETLGIIEREKYRYRLLSIKRDIDDMDDYLTWKGESG